MTSSTNGQPVLVSGERRDKQRTEEQARADREATKQAFASAQIYRAMFPQLWDEK